MCKVSAQNIERKKKQRQRSCCQRQRKPSAMIDEQSEQHVFFSFFYHIICLRMAVFQRNKSFMTPPSFFRGDQFIHAFYHLHGNDSDNDFPAAKYILTCLASASEAHFWFAISQ